MRMTRAALRAQAQEEPQLVFEDADADSFHTSPDLDANQDPSRAPLKDITTETNAPAHEDPFVDEDTAPMKKHKTKKVGKRGNDKIDSPVELEHAVERTSLIEDLSGSAHSQSSDETTQSNTLSLQRSSDIEFVHDELPAGIAKEHGQTPHTSASTPSHPHSDSVPKTPRFDPTVHKPLRTPAGEAVEDSFVEKITSRTPGRVLSFQEESMSPNLFIETLTSRTPRIEDSVEAIDALEDAIEKVAETLPALDDLKIESPVKSRKSTSARVTTKSNTLGATSAKKPVPTPSQSQRVSPAKTRAPAVTDRPKITTTRQSSVKSTAKPAITAKPTKKPTTDGHKLRQSSALAPTPTLSFSNSPAKSLPNTTKKRVPSEKLSTSRPAFVPAKSTKPPTVSTFQLPSAAISAKVKAQREERLKREEEAEKEKKMFKARPVPAKVARPSVLPRENKASQARVSIYANGVNKENVAPTRNTITIQPKIRPSSLDAKPRSSSDLAPTKANSGVRRTTTSAAAVAKPRVSSLTLTTGQKLSVTKLDGAQQKARGKEVFGRSKVDLERIEKERKEKEEATRKARAEAAERGRQASREWAEKQKKKIAAQAKDKALAATAISA